MNFSVWEETWQDERGVVIMESDPNTHSSQREKLPQKAVSVVRLKRGQDLLSGKKTFEENASG